MSKKIDFVAKTVEGKRIAIEDEFIKEAGISGDGEISIKVNWSTYGEVAKWMSCYTRKQFESEITKENYKEFNDKHFFRWEDNMVKNCGIWLGTLYGTKEKFDALDREKRLPSDTPFMDIVAKGITHKWDEEVRVISFYTGRQGPLMITVYDKKTGVCMFTFTSNGMFLNFKY